MPFMIGREPVRRTLRYLQAGRLVLKDAIQIFSINYNTHGKNSFGMRDFIFWHMPQVMYKNPQVQVVTIRNKTPTPFIWCFYDDGRRMLIDVDFKNKDEILEHLVQVVGKSKEVLKNEAIAREKKDNPANFGYGCEKNCACIIPGQLPCPAVVPLPFHMRGKFYLQKQEIF